MLRNNFVFILAFSVVLCNAQLITFKDGKVGVNFLGYHASAGLGGLLTGRAADGGLSASAGTPYGQNAAAGLGGSIDGSGRSAGGLYAGAQAAKGIEASAGLGGVVSNDQLAGTIFSRATKGGVESVNVNEDGITSEITNTQSNVVQKVKPPKKFIPSPQPLAFIEKRIGFVNNAQPAEVSKTLDATIATGVVTSVQSAVPAFVQYEARPFGFHKRLFVRPRPRLFWRKTFVPFSTPSQVETRIGTNVETRDSTAVAGTGGFQTTVTKNVGPSSTLFDSIFNIPIQTLRAVNEFLNTKASSQANVSVQKTVTYG